MSELLPNSKLTTTFAYNKVEAVGGFGLPGLQRDHSARAPSEASSKASTTARVTRRNVDRAEPCFVTKRPSFTLERAHWVNAVRSDPSRKRKIETFLLNLGIVHVRFDLNDPSNLTNLDRMLHVSFDKYGFFAVTPTLATLRQLISMVEKENHEWQRRFDEGGSYIRFFRFRDEAIVNAQYELVVLHPEHFLPNGSDLTVFSHANDGQLSGKRYVVGQDRTLRELPGTLDCPRLPAFAFDAAYRRTLPLNVFLVVLNAEIKFRRFKRMTLTQRLPSDVENLIDVTIQLADLIYWRPTTNLTDYHQLMANVAPAMEVDAPNVQDAEMGLRSSADEDNEETIRSSNYNRVIRRPGATATAEEQREYAHYLLSHDDDLDSDEEELLEELGLVPESLIERPAMQGPRIDLTGNIREWKQAVEAH